MPPRHHVVITGTGRSGTTFLVELLTHLGLETGFTLDELVSQKCGHARAGLEYDIRRDDCPYVVKNPWFCDHAEEVLSRSDIVIDRVLVPVRDLQAAAESRRHVVKTALSGPAFFKRMRRRMVRGEVAGGLWHTRSSAPGDQEEILLKQIYSLVLALSDTGVPVTFMRFPRIVKAPRYLFEKLRPILSEPDHESFRAAFERTVRPDLVHSFNANDR